ncbi:hypothetical protein IGI04_001846 [Brassica rapa subsp. trilocularis]|uniref:Polycomb protein VEFS-Box domain-containing protein n=2 Tax=Brassica TaxID=3705 RepID=A0ABQ7NU06_BRACM|nr:polycomb group protein VERNALIZATION 2 isoform X2 [Brassica rapa]KAG5414279.1 hypothetical protein IGI04_001846 [Brassica rapa subsp. trilocularis]
MSQEDSQAKSSHDGEKHWMYLKPVRLYDMLLCDSPSKQRFLRRNLNYKNQEKGETRSASAGMVLFNFKDFDNKVQKTQVTKNCSCPFCKMLCGNFKGLQLHLNSFHELLEFEFMTSEENQTVNVSVRLDAFKTKDQRNIREKFGDLSFCSKPFKRTQVGGRNIPKRLNVTILPMDPPFLADDTETGTSLLNNGNPVAMMNVPDIGQSSGSGARESEGPAAKTRKLSEGTSEARRTSLLQTRQFYHSRTLQMIDDLEDVSPTEKDFMHLWKSFVRYQRVITDGQVPWACEAFSKFHKKEFIESKPLHSCWRMFMIKLLEYGLIDAVTINKCNLIIEDSEDDHSVNTNNNNSVDYGNNSVDYGIDLNRNDTMDVDHIGVDLGIGLGRNTAMDVNNNNVDRGIDLNLTMNVNPSNVDRGIDLNRNDVMDADEDVNDSSYLSLSLSL